MKVQTETVKQIQMVMTEDEAIWLKTILQNHLSDEEESESDYEMRGTFWNALCGVDAR